MSKLKVMVIVGTRPEIIRLARVIALLRETVDLCLVHTGQNYDHELSQVFFDELELPHPDHNLGVDTSSLGALLGGTLVGAERVMRAERPDAVLILGDTNSAIAGIMAKRLKIPLFHMEAGNRCYDQNVPEEINRRLIDHISDFNLVYSEHARRQLLGEGLPHRRIYLTGSPMKEVLDHFRPGIDASPVLEELGLQPGGYLLASVHREENVDRRERLTQVLEILRSLHERFQRPIVVSTHPRTRDRLNALGGAELEGVRFLKPFGYFAYNKLQLNAFCVVSDSGSISEESSILGFPAVTVRRAMERPEAMDTGSIVLTGLDPEVVLASVELITRTYAEGPRPPTPVGYQVDNVSRRVAQIVLGCAKLSNAWDGIEANDLGDRR